MNNLSQKQLLSFMVVMILFTFGCQKKTDSQVVKVLSYNIHHGQGTDGIFNLERIAQLIKRLNPDIVALQEVDSCTDRSSGADQAAILGQLTGMHHIFGRAMAFDGGSYGNALLSNYPILSANTSMLPGSLDHEPRCALSAEIKIGKQLLMFTGTHLDHFNHESDRVLQAEAINTILYSVNRPMILAGDLNETPGGPSNIVFMKMWMDGSQDNPQPTSPSVNPARRIDYILFKPEQHWEVISSEVINEPTASDHNPLLVAVRLKTSERYRSNQ